MSFTNSNDYITGAAPVPTPASAGELCAVRFTLSMATGDLAANTIGQIGILPAGYLPHEVYVDGTDMDSSTAAMVLQVGIWDGSSSSLSTDSADGGGHWGVTTATNAAFRQALTPNGRGVAGVSTSTSDRKIGVKVATAPTTPVAGTLGVTLVFRSPA